MKNKEKRKYIFIFLVIVGITVFIGYTLSKFDRDIQERVYYKQVENMRRFPCREARLWRSSWEDL